MARKRDYEKLAKLKEQMSELKKEVDELQASILSNNPMDEISTRYGILKLSQRRNIDVTDNTQLIKQSSITQTIFINTAKISASVLQKMLGDTEWKELSKKNVIVEKEPTKYYKLSQPKKPK